MIQWETALPFITKSSADLIQKKYSKEEVKEMIRNIEREEQKPRQKNKGLLRLILLDLVFIYTITE